MLGNSFFSFGGAMPSRSRDHLPAGTTTLSSAEYTVVACLFDPKRHLSAFPAQWAAIRLKQWKFKDIFWTRVAKEDLKHGNRNRLERADKPGNSCCCLSIQLSDSATVATLPAIPLYSEITFCHFREHTCILLVSAWTMNSADLCIYKKG